MAINRDIHIDRSETWDDFSFTWKDDDGNPYNLTGFTAKMQVRPNAKSSRVILELTTENGGISIGGETGKVSFLVSREDLLEITDANGEYDLVLFSAGGIPDCLFRGRVTFGPAVTR